MCVHQGWGSWRTLPTTSQEHLHSCLLGFIRISNNDGCETFPPPLPPSPTVNGGPSQPRCVLKGTFQGTRVHLSINSHPSLCQGIQEQSGWRRVGARYRWDLTHGVICSESVAEHVRSTGTEKNWVASLRMSNSRSAKE